MAKRSQSKGPSGSTALSHLGVATGALAGVLVYEGLGYFYHRSMHASDLLWRGLHQMHHSAERIDTWSAFWFHPFDMIGWTAMSSLALTLIVGLSPPRRRLRCSSSRCCRSSSTPTCAPRAGLATSSSVPKAIPGTDARGRHRNNYADVPLFDILFGTFDNPRDFAPATGFYDGASSRMAEMLLLREVSVNPLTRSR